jgi:hypothetical protein
MTGQQQSQHRTIPTSLHLVAGAIALLAFVPQMQAQIVPGALTTATHEDAGNVYPDAPSALLLASASENEAEAEELQRRNALPLCPPKMPPPPPSTMPTAEPTTPPPLCREEDPLRIVVNSEQRQPLSSHQKAVLAVRDVIDPFNLVVIAGEAGIGIGTNSHSVYGPGFKGFGKLAGYDLAQDAQGEFFGTFLIPSLTHEDPRYRRMQNASVKRRIFHALERTIIAQHDDGRPMPNYATLLTYPISAELSNLYVPGVQDDRSSTAKRIGIGLATDPVGNLLAEFLPDIARRIHVRSVFMQQIVTQIATGQPLGNIQ